MSAAEQLIHLTLTLSGIVLIVATATLSVAVALLAAWSRHAFRRPHLAQYDIVVPAGAPPTAELFLTHLHALFRGGVHGLLQACPEFVLIARGSPVGLRMAIAIESGSHRRVAAALATLWPEARLVAGLNSEDLPRHLLVWHPHRDSATRTAPLPGAADVLVRALTRVGPDDELSIELALRPDGAERLSLITGLLTRNGLRPERHGVHAGRRREVTHDETHFACCFALSAKSPRDSRAHELLSGLVPSVEALCIGSGLQLGKARRRKTTRLMRPSVLERRRLSPSELVPLFPLVSFGVAASAASLPQTDDGERLLGLRSRASRDVEVRLSLAESRQHLHLLGATGSGKSTLLLNLAAQDIVSGRGCAVLDPKGDLVRDLLERVPEDRMNDVVYLGPDEGARAVGINPLALEVDEDPNLAAENVLSIIKRIYEENWGPRTDDVLKSCLLTLVVEPGSTLAHVPALLTNSDLRRRLTAHVDDAIGVGGFWRWYDRLSEAKRLEAIAPLQNKLRDFLVRPRLRHLLCQPRSSVDLRSLMDRGGILLADLGTGRWGENASALAGSFLVARLWQAALSRQALTEDRRRDFLLYVDEFQSFLGIGGPFADALAQARGLRLSLTLANQHLGQLPREIRDAVAANARSRIAFRCAGSDAAALSADLPSIDPAALVVLPPFQAAVRLASAPSAFVMRTLPASSPAAGAVGASRVIAASGARFGRDRAGIDSALRVLSAPTHVSSEPDEV